jgi:hypothetical protein
MPHRLVQFEHRSQPVIGVAAFYKRMGRNLLYASGIVAVSLAIGMAGYIGLEGQGVLDAFLSAAMILGGMGPVSPIVTDAGKVFAGVYALYSGLVLIFTAGVLLAPLAHRLLHHLHVETEDDKSQR